LLSPTDFLEVQRRMQRIGLQALELSICHSLDMLG
jgi:hypothetical protein